MILCGANRIEMIDGAPTRVHEPEDVDPRDLRWAASELLTGSAVLTGADSWDHRSYITDRLVQGASSCVGHSVRRATMQCAAVIQHDTLSSRSALFPYTLARLFGEMHISRLLGAPRLNDWGCGVRWALKGVRDLGLPHESAWRETPENINAVPDFAALRAGESSIVQSFHRVDDGPSKSAELRAAGRRGFDPIVCLVVDQKFVEIGREVYDGPGGVVLGGHAMVAVGYSAILRAFCFDNWWGTDVGDDGYFWISEDVINARSYDTYVVESAPGG